MSAWIVSKAHIDALVTGLEDAGLITDEDLTAIGQELWDENHASINCRYGEHNKAPEYAFSPLPLTPGALLKAIGCYCYQTCEHPAWGKSTAYRLMRDLEIHHGFVRENEDAIPEAFRADYDSAPWGIP